MINSLLASIVLAVWYYGYVGAAPGRITLYKGRTVVERNIPQEEALDRLIALIRENGDWQEPE